MTNQGPALLVQRAPWTRAAVMLGQSLFTTPYWEHVTKRVQTKIFAFSRHVACIQPLPSTFRAAIGSGSQQTLRTAVYSYKFKMATKKTAHRDENKGCCCGCVGPHWNQIDVKSWGFFNTALKRARFIHTMLRKNFINSRQWGNSLESLAAAWSCRALQKMPPLYLRKKLPGTVGNFKVN